MQTCEHLVDLAPVEPVSPDGCLECLQQGGRWVHLRLCMTCGHVGCCDSSPGQHATVHALATDHPVLQSFEVGEDWAWCRADDQWLRHVSPDVRRP